MNINKYDKPYRIAPAFDTKKAHEMFNLALKLDTHELLQYSLINQVPFDIQDDDGHSLIHVVITIDSRKASPLSKLSVIKFLVQQGVNPDKPNKYNQTPLHLACQIQSDAIVEYLLSIDVDANFKDNMGLTPFHYLLTGDIKTIDNNTEIMDFVPAPKDVDVKKNTELLEIKKLVNDIINTSLDEKLPIYKTINETIKNILEFDPVMIETRIKLQDKIVSIAKNTSSKDTTLEIKTLIDSSQNETKKKILSQFNNLPDLSDLTIHNKEPNSWAPPTNTSGMALIKNGNIKRVIKDDIIKCKDEIIKLKDDFLLTKLEDINNVYILQILYDYYYEKHYVKSDVPNLNFESFNDEIRHPDAIDNASSIINFNTLKYAGGPRNITVKFPPNIDSTYKDPIIYPFVEILKLSEEAKILYMLGSIITSITIADILKNKSSLLKDYFQLAYYAIINQDEFIKYKAETNFGKKWYNIYIKGCDISTWIFGMCTNLSCRNSKSNLVGDIKFRTLMLIAGLGLKNKTSLSLGIINAYKPHLIQYITTLGLSKELTITKMVLILLLNTDDETTITDILSGSTNINYSILNKYIIYTCTLVYKYFEDTNIDHSEFNKFIKIETETSNYYNRFKHYNDKPIDVLCRIIFDNYDQMVNKPLKQTILDFIYLLIKYNNDNTKDINIFKEITFTDFYNGIRVVSVSKHDENMLPSKYGYLNYLLDEPTLNSRNLNHFYIAHLLGLYYEGSFSMKLDKPLKYDGLEFTPSDVDGITGIKNHHIVPLTLDLAINQIQFPLNFISINPAYPTVVPKDKFYDIGNDKILILPDICSYFALLYTRIQHYWTEINKLNIQIEEIINKLINGDVSKLKELYTSIYPKIILYSKIIDNFNNSYTEFKEHTHIKEIWGKLPATEFKELYKTTINFDYKILARNLNNINSRYYLYYYIYSPNKLIKLSRFNYYQIPENDVSKYIYYSKDSENKIINIDVEENTDNNAILGLGGAETVVKEPLNRGLINEFSLGNYDKFLTEYINGKFSTIAQINDESFVRIKDNKLPPSLHSALSDFYTYTLIELIKKVVTVIDKNKLKTTPEKILYDKIKELVRLNNIKVEDNDLSLYKIIADIIQELVKEQYNIYIYNAIYDTYTTTLTLTTASTTTQLPTTNLLTKKEMAISFETTKIVLDKKTIKRGIKNLYDFLIKPKKENIFILYPNDLTNINRLKTKYGIIINTKIITLLLEKRGFIHHLNMDNLTPLYSLLKNYNYEPIKALKNLGIDFRDFEGVSPCEFIKEDLSNNLNKILNNINNKPTPTTRDILNNFDNYLYNDVKLLISSNEVFGNNILSYLPLSFNMSTYLTLQYLVENLINTDNEYSFDDVTELFNFMNIDINNINKNFLGETLNVYKIPNSFELLIADELLEEKEKDLKLLEEEQNIIDGNIKKLDVLNSSLAKQMKETTKYKKLDEDINLISDNITEINKFKKTVKSNIINNVKSADYKIISRYNKINKNVNHNSLIMKAWEKVLNLEYSNKNYNLGLIQLLIKQKNLIENLNISNLEQLKKMSKGLNKLAQIGEDYFNKPKLTEQNKVAHFIRDMLEYISELTIATSIELIMRRILFTYFSNISTTDSIDEINSSIDHILETPLIGYSKSIIQTLKEDIAPELAKNASEIFDNRSDKEGYNNRPVREILLNLFKRLDAYPMKLSHEILSVFNKEVVLYFDTFISKSIMLWQINAENIFKYFINNYRCIQTLIEVF
jgi:hypothetical protein